MVQVNLSHGWPAMDGQPWLASLVGNPVHVYDPCSVWCVCPVPVHRAGTPCPCTRHGRHAHRAWQRPEGAVGLASRAVHTIHGVGSHLPPCPCPCLCPCHRVRICVSVSVCPCVFGQMPVCLAKCPCTNAPVYQCTRDTAPVYQCTRDTAPVDP